MVIYDRSRGLGVLLTDGINNCLMTVCDHNSIKVEILN